MSNAIKNAKEANQKITKFIEGKCLTEDYVSSNSEIRKGGHPIFSDHLASDEVVIIRVSLVNITYGCILLDNFYSGRKTSKKDADIIDKAVGLFALILYNMRMHKGEEYELLSMIFHRLRTDIAYPLHAVKSALKNHNSSDLNLPLMQRKLWEVFMNANDLLHYSKTRLEITTPNRIEIKTSDVLAEILDGFSFKRDISCFDNLVPNGLALYADKGMIKHALLNLIDNAIKYSPDKSKIVIYSQVCDSGRLGIMVKNKPTSPLTEDDLLSLFERFKRGTQSMGEGVGLYIVKKIIEAHGGQVVAKNDGEYVVFGFEIPVSEKTT